MKKLLLIVFCFLVAFSSINAQELESPSPGKSLIYFVRTSGAGALINFKYFDGDKYLGKFSGTNYIIYECDPGEHLFWVGAENRDFVKASLAADKVYMIHAIATMGAFKAAVRLQPIEKSDAKAMKRVNKLLSKKEPLQLDQAKVDAEAPKLEFFIKNGLEKYERDQEKGKQPELLTEDMYHN